MDTDEVINLSNDDNDFSSKVGEQTDNTATAKSDLKGAQLDNVTLESSEPKNASLKCAELSSATFDEQTCDRKL